MSLNLSQHGRYLLCMRGIVLFLGLVTLTDIPPFPLLSVMVCPSLLMGSMLSHRYLTFQNTSSRLLLLIPRVRIIKGKFFPMCSIQEKLRSSQFSVL
ncbi:hypothetical protein BDP27DRAFT_492879 [Rhodocollybia butyracea]|uniref:Uncharacterized protein n=1 Tax=Rhodocollybia butyracea TaxID=206335 RepID=A0A9P5U935_9AGAR|nr:hypothetical protein BDP27DRAFT_492879 [Rhodocollybia butyracea]